MLNVEASLYLMQILIVKKVRQKILSRILASLVTVKVEERISVKEAGGKLRRRSCLT
jgi:hypothetical protein